MKKVFIALFLLICLVPSVGMLLAGPEEAAANEQLAQAPALDGDYLPSLAQWVNDRFYLRSHLISLDRWLTGNVLATSGEESVVLGSDGWLYYGPTVASYTGTQRLTDRELSYIAHNLSLMEGYCEESGKAFAFVIAPNKNSLYGDWMPDYGVKAEASDAQRLYALLDENGTSYIDLFEAFGAQQEVLYFQHDSHWNSKGAALGADRINAAFGVDSDYFGGDFSHTSQHDGDLYAMLYPGFTDPEEAPVYGGELAYEFTGRATQADAITLETAGQGRGSLLAYRDSFGNLLYPYLAHSYASARFSRSTSYDLTLEADFVLIELVERNLAYLITYVPVMPSPETQITIPEASDGELTAQTGKRSGLLQLRGTLPEEVDAAWVVADGVAYDAFLLAQGGFAVNLAQEAQSYYVVYTVGEKNRMYELTTEGN